MFCSKNHVIGYGNKKCERMYQDPAASLASGADNNEGKTGSSDGVVGHGPSVPSHHTAAQLLLSSIVAASVDNSLSRGPSQRSQQTHRSSELFLLLWKRSGDIGHAVMALNSFCGPT